jgi:drug/metabolite transporter (DMT)-like permease
MSLLSALLWAAASLVDKFAVNWEYRTLEILPATYTAGFIVVAWGQRNTPELWQPIHILSGAGLAVFSLLNAFALLMALRRGSVGLVSIVAGSHCVLTAIAATFLFGEKIALHQWFGILLSLLGLILVHGINPAKIETDGSKGSRLWFWLALLAAIGSSGETLGLKFATNLSAGAQYALIWEYFIGSLVCHLLVAIYLVRLRLASSLFGLMDGFLTGLGMLTFGIALSLGPASLVATVATAAVLFRALGGVVFFGDQARASQWLGFFILICSFVLVQV